MKLFMRESTFFVGIPELWNFVVTQRLASFAELTGTCQCLSVSEDLVACIMETQVCFLNVLKTAIVARTLFPEGISISLSDTKFIGIGMIACSRLYHVLMQFEGSTYLLQYANSVDLNSCVFNNIVPKVRHFITSACFSPNGQLLAFRFFGWETLYVLDIATLNVRCKFSLYSTKRSDMEFVDEKHLLCEGYNDCLCLINVKTCDILTCISLSLENNRCKPWSVFAFHNTVGIIVYSSDFEKLIRFKLWLPQHRKDGNELLECSCFIHAGIINDLPTPP